MDWIFFGSDRSVVFFLDDILATGIWIVLSLPEESESGDLWRGILDGVTTGFNSCRGDGCCGGCLEDDCCFGNVWCRDNGCCRGDDWMTEGLVLLVVLVTTSFFFSCSNNLSKRNLQDYRYRYQRVLYVHIHVCIAPLWDLANIPINQYLYR